MKKELLKTMCAAVVLLGMTAPAAYGQLSEGTTFAQTIRTGNRPVAGDWGIYIGPSVTNIIDMVNNSNGDDWWRGIPLVNVKYYWDDNWEARLGIRSYSNSEKQEGDVATERNLTQEYLNKTKTSETHFSPGIAYHFSPQNLLDVYVGAAIPFGFSVDKSFYLEDDFEMNATRNSFVLGMEAFIGLQCFIADLPLAVGLEYGFSGLKKFGQKTKHEVIEQNGNEQVYYTAGGLDDGYGLQFAKLSSTKGSFGGDLRVTISYYFH